MNNKKLEEILDKHLKWLRGEDGGERANLTRADLTGDKLGLPPNRAKRRRKMSPLTRDAAETRRQGLTYGQYKAKSYVPPEPLGGREKEGGV